MFCLQNMCFIFNSTAWHLATRKVPNHFLMPLRWQYLVKEMCTKTKGLHMWEASRIKSAIEQSSMNALGFMCGKLLE